MGTIARYSFVIIFSISLFSCSQKAGNGIIVESHSDKKLSEYRTFVILPANGTNPEGDLQFKKLSNLLAVVLNTKGFTERLLTKADMVITLDYGFGEPQNYDSIHYAPIFGILNPNTKEPPRYGITNYIPTTRQNTYYSSYLTITAYDLKEYFKRKTFREIWSVRLIGDSSLDLNDDISTLIAASKGFIGYNTGQPTELNSEHFQYDRSQNKKLSDYKEQFISAMEKGLAEWERQNKSAPDYKQKRKLYIERLEAMMAWVTEECEKQGHGFMKKLFASQPIVRELMINRDSDYMTGKEVVEVAKKAIVILEAREK